jgi:hypothetical protein
MLLSGSSFHRGMLSGSSFHRGMLLSGSAAVIVVMLCYRQLQSLEHSVVSDVRLILTILQQQHQHTVHSSESSGSSMIPDYREVR